MRPFGIGFAATVVAAVFSLTMFTAPAAAAPKAKAEAGPGAVSKDQRAKGMAAAAGLVSSAGVQCQVADARLIGESADAKTKVKHTFYELACSDNEGVIVATSSDAPAPQVFTCMETAAPTAGGKPNGLACVLPGNADPKAGLLPYVAKAGAMCAPDQIRALGHSATNTDFELKCHEGGGFILMTSAPPRTDKPVTVKPCVIFDPAGTVKCELTDRTAQLAVADRLAAQSGKACVVKDRAYVGISESGQIYYEVACQDGKGYVLEQAANGALTKTIDCASADYLNGGCKLTDARSAKTEQSGLYTQLARKAGFACDVSGYAPFSVNPAGKEVVELACSNRPDGGIAIFGVKAGDSSVVYDCAHSELKNFRCGLTKPAAAYPKLTAELKTLGKSSCAVSNARTVGVTADQRGFIEVACSDGLPGYMIEYSAATVAPKNAIACASAGSIAGGCTLPGNSKKS